MCAGSPTHILALTGNRLSSNAVSLSWDAPPNGGSILYGFTIEGYNIFGMLMLLPVVLNNLPVPSLLYRA